MNHGLSGGEWVTKFEDSLIKFTGAKFAVAITNGTNALRMSLHVAGVLPGDEVLMPSLSFVATANAVAHLGAVPHFVDIESNSLGICPNALRNYLEEIAEKKGGEVFNKITGRRIGALIPVHIYGNPANMKVICPIAKLWNLPIVEDAAEALGSWIKVNKKFKHCGLFGELGAISFNGNKIITTGGGGAIITNNFQAAKLAKHLSTTSKINHKWEFDHDQIGWNDRMPNINAALGVSQIERIDQIISLKEK